MIPISAQNWGLLDSIEKDTGFVLVKAHHCMPGEGTTDPTCSAFPVVFRHPDGRQVNVDGKGPNPDEALRVAIVRANEKIRQGKAQSSESAQE